MNGFSKRLVSGVFLAGGVAAAAFWAPSVSVAVVLCTVATLAIMEFYHLLDAMAIPSFRIMGAVASVLLIAGTWASFTLETASLAAEHELIVLFAALIAVLIRQFPQKNNEQPLATMACTLFGIMYVPFLFNYLTKLLFAWDTPGPLSPVGPTGRLLVLYLVAVVKCTDIGAYAVGSRLGRHKLFPRVSPRKTWEGFFGGVGAGLLVSVLVQIVSGGRLGRVTLTLADAAVLGLVLPVMGTVGDLAESLVKRAADRKDSSTLVPGMGGALDILDSLLFAAPTLYIYLSRFLGTP